MVVEVNFEYDVLNGVKFKQGGISSIISEKKSVASKKRGHIVL